ncbi:MAG: Mrp/NBP35 family ATP-binding protein [Alistipes sp.]|jgi:ATP-binding protein involved in chromosome partitioning|nr:Mrp/NBP35 family ATP-binding protein [Alistipes sp.]
MVDREDISMVLDGILHPEGGVGLVSGGFVGEIGVIGDRIEVELRFRRGRDPFSGSLRRRAVEVLTDAFPGMGVGVTVAAAGVPPVVEPERRLAGVDRVLAVASGKGGVGKSTVAAGLALALVEDGYRVGVLDADIYGPSQPSLFGVEGWLPVAEADGDDGMIVPAESSGVKIMSIGFFISPDDALLWRGPMAVNALRQLIRQTAWGGLDYLLVDLPPGTGDVHLSVATELEIDGAIIVTTPGRLAVADVRRGVEMFRSEGIGVPVLGVVENMAWFTPAELPGNRYYIFGKGDGREFAAGAGIDFLGDVPIVMPASGSDGGDRPGPAPAPGLREYYGAIARRVVDKVGGKC